MAKKSKKTQQVEKAQPPVQEEAPAAATTKQTGEEVTEGCRLLTVADPDEGLDLPADPKAAKSLKLPKQPKPKKVTRVSSATRTILDNIGLTYQEMVVKANEDFTGEGGSDNEKESKWAIDLALQVLTATKLVKVDGEKIVAAGQMTFWER